MLGNWQVIYLYGLGIAGAATILYAIFSDVFHAVDLAPHPLLSPISFLSFFAILSGVGYILLATTLLSNLAVLGLSAGISFILVTLMAVFILAPLARAEESNSIRMQDFIGTFGEVVITIAEGGCGEVILTRNTGIQNMTAKSLDGTVVPAGAKVLINDVKDGVVFVTPVPQHLLANMKKGGTNTWQS